MLTDAQYNTKIIIIYIIFSNTFFDSLSRIFILPPGKIKMRGRAGEGATIDGVDKMEKV